MRPLKPRKWKLKKLQVEVEEPSAPEPLPAVPGY